MWTHIFRNMGIGRISEGPKKEVMFISKRVGRAENKFFTYVAPISNLPEYMLVSTERIYFTKSVDVRAAALCVE